MIAGISPAERVEATAILLAAVVASEDMPVSADMRVGEADAAALLGLSAGHLKNLRQQGGAPIHYTVGVGGGRVSYSIQALRSIDLSTGWGTEAKATAANVLAGLGVAPKSAEMFAANAQKFQSVAMDRLMKKQIEQKGTSTEGDAKRLNQTYVSLQNRPEANDFILDLTQAQANMDARKAAYYEAALPIAQKRGDLTEIDRQWRKVAGSILADPLMQRWMK
ncbi:Uncharacterised protein [Xylophilus ampelinus]|nr:Uncharacterised protein [Xylophilus ampelinus]